MTRALAALHDTTYGGVYYSANIDFTNSGFNPTWTKYATTGLANTLIKVMQNDRFDPYNRVYVQLDNNDVYLWNGASWDKIMDAATAAALTGGSDTYGYLYVDTLTPGTIYFPCHKGVTWVKLLKSVDYGANWTVKLVISTTIVGVPFVTAHGNNVIVTTANPSARAYFSSDGGDLWSAGSAGRTSVPHRQDPNNPSSYYDPTSNVDKDLSIYSVGGSTQLQNGVFLATAYDVSNSSVHIFDYNVPGYQRLLLPAAGTLKLYITNDYWTNATTPATWNDYGGYLVNMKTMAAALENTDYLLIGGGSDGSPGVCRVYAKNGNDATVPWLVSGANYAAAPYTDSIPTPSASYIAYSGLWVGEAPASLGVYVYANELGDITDLPTYTGLGRPMFGDRSAWRDMQADGFDIYHAQDVQAATPQLHNPWPAASGTAPVSDGAKYVATDITTQAELTAHTGDASAHHAPITLGADADVLLGLSDQQVIFDNQDANKVLAGPTSGVPAKPTVRSLVAADVGTGTPDGSKYLRDDLTWQAITPGVAGVVFVFGFHVAGVLSTGTLPVRLLTPFSGTIDHVAVSVNTAPTDASLIIDLHKGGTTIFTNQANRPTITTGNNDDTSSIPDVTSITQNDVFTLDIDQVGSTIAGADLNVQIRCIKT